MLKTFLRLVLVAALIYSFMLYRWSEKGDPRFFAALDSKPGRILARVFKWQGAVTLGKGELDTEPAKLSAAETNYRSMVERDFLEAAPLLGITPVEASGDRVRIRYKDIRLKQRFPEAVGTSRDGVTIFLSRPHLIGARAIHDALSRQLDGLRTAFREYPGLKNSAEKFGDRIDIVLFPDEPGLKKFFQESSLNSEHTLGAFDLATRTVFAVDPRGLAGERRAEAMTTLRHEAAHAWFYARGIHSVAQTEGNWLIEGLAVYAQGEGIGETSGAALAVLRKARAENALLPIAHLVRMREREGFLGLGNPDRIEIAYLQSWALVHLLMSDAHRTRFLGYLGYLANPAYVSQIAQTDPYQILLRMVGLGAEELEAAAARSIGR